MTSLEVAARRTAPAVATMQDKLRYAQALADSGLLPAQYRKQPANVLYAVEYGDMLGLSTMAAITGIHVIEGKPTASAGLIGGLVRVAGHRLRVTLDRATMTAIATIHRSDDPEFEYRSEWTLDRARKAELTSKKVWKQYPEAMLKARAITEVARDAAEDVLFGLHYTPEELGAEVDESGELVQVTSERADIPVQASSSPEVVDWDAAMNSAAGNYDVLRALWQRASTLGAPQDVLTRIKDLGIVAAAAQEAAGGPKDAVGTEEIHEGEIVDEAKAEGPERPSKKQLQFLNIALTERGLSDRDRRLTVVASIVEHPVTTTGELTIDELKLVIRKLDEWADDAPLVIANILETEPATASL